MKTSHSLKYPIRSLSLLAVALACAFAIFGCNSTTNVATGPTPVKCAVTLTLGQAAMDSSGGAGTVTVSSAAECAWTATSEVGWITDLSPAAGQGTGDIHFQVAPNPNQATRQGAIVVNGVRATLGQGAPACDISIAPTSQAVPAGTSSGSVHVSGASGCGWAAASNAPWLTVTSGSTGSGAGLVTFSVAANSGTVARVGTLTIASQTFTVAQPEPGAVPCTNSIQPTSQNLASSAGSFAVTITATSSCSWTALSNVPWLAVTGTSTGTGNGTVTISATANTGNTRIGTATIAGQTLTVTQTGSCLATFAPPNASLAAGAGNSSTAVTIAAGCAWTASTSDSWITITSGSSGTGNGSVAYSVAANTGSSRAGTITIANQSFSVTQAGSCAASLNPASQSVGAAAGSATVGVTVAAGCAWTASTTASWITITSGANGTGNGTVGFDFAVNPNTTTRTGTITIAGQTHTVTQAGACPISINPASQSVPATAGAGTPVAVTAPSGCAWTASTTTPWITITSGASGSGNGTVAFSVAANPDTTSRSGTITIAGQTHTVTQAGSCPASINPASQTVGAAGGAATNVAVTTPSGCGWTASTTATWITITSGASGTGNGTVKFTVDANTGPQRADVLTIAGQTHTVTQSSGCTFAINPTSQTLSKNPQTGTTITVTAGAGCDWTAVSNISWITIQTGASGTGNDTVTFAVANNNTGSQRVGTMTIAGRTFTVTQNK